VFPFRFKLSRCTDTPVFFLEATDIDDCECYAYLYQAPVLVLPSHLRGIGGSDLVFGDWVSVYDGFPTRRETSELEFLVLTGITLELSWKKSLEEDTRAITKT